MPGSVLAGAGESFCWPDRPLADGDILRMRGHFPPAGGILRVWGRESGPRRRRMPPPGTTRIRPRGMSPPVLAVERSGEVMSGLEAASCAGDVTRVRRWAGVRSAQPYV